MSLPQSDLEGLGLYVHFPWCLKKCPYCDFLSVAVPSDVPGQPLSAEQARARLPHEAYADAVIAELQRRLSTAWPDGEYPKLRSVFIGGGTPSLWHPGALARVLAAVRESFNVSQDSNLEITVECNPTSIDEAHVEQLLLAGVNRVSIGVQALDNDRLEFLGRLHDSSGGLQAVRTAIQAGMPRVSADLIFGVYRQTPEKALSDVMQIAETGVGHISAYSLTIEPGTRFGALDAKGKLPLLDDALVAESFEQVSTALEQIGFEHYEISNYAKPGLRSEHNQGYWLGRDYLGLGTGAYGTIQFEDERIRYRNQISPERYLETWTARPLPPFEPFGEKLADSERISPDEAVQEGLLLGLRLKDGFELESLAQLRGATALPPERAKNLEKLCAEGRIRRIGNRLSLPKNEWIFADRTIRELL